MQRRTLLRALAASGAGALATANAAVIAWRDVLDTPAGTSPLAPKGLLNGLARAGKRLVAVGQRGHVLFSDDAGHRWRQASVPVSSDLVAVCFATANAGWAVGHDGVVLHSSDAGASWVRQLDGRRLGELLVAHYTRSGDDKWLAEARRFAEQGAENPFLDVWFQDARVGYAVGAFGLALRTMDGGAHWEPMLHELDNPKGLHVYAVRGLGADVMMVGEQGLALKLDRDAGRLRALELPYKGTLFGLAGTERAIVAHGLRGSVVRSTDGGRSWQAVPTGVSVGLTASALDEQGRLVIVSQAGHVLLSRDDGASFTPVKLDRPFPAAAVAAAGPGRLVVAGPRGAHAVALS
jgi:photosystem II stability/assembly factor-like uncharacterized protein